VSKKKPVSPVKSLTSEQISNDIRKVAEKLKKVPEKHEYLTLSPLKVREWQIRKTHGGWAAALSASGALKFDDPEIKTVSDLRLKHTELRDEIKRLKEHINQIEEDALSSKSLKALVYGIEGEPRGDLHT